MGVGNFVSDGMILIWTMNILTYIKGNSFWKTVIIEEYNLAPYQLF
jgi:hypothetical protein